MSNSNFITERVVRVTLAVLRSLMMDWRLVTGKELLTEVRKETGSFEYSLLRAVLDDLTNSGQLIATDHGYILPLNCFSCDCGWSRRKEKTEKFRGFIPGEEDGLRKHFEDIFQYEPVLPRIWDYRSQQWCGIELLAPDKAT